MNKIIRLGILISGSGSTMEAVARAASPGGPLDGKVIPAVVIASKPGIGGIEKAKNLNIPICIIERKQFAKDASGAAKYGQLLLHTLMDNHVDWVSLNGWMPLVPELIIRKFSHKIVNQHPGPLDPDHLGNDGKPLHFGGRGMHGKAVAAAVLKFNELSGRNIPGEATIHYVTVDFDMGRVLARTAVPVQKHDTPESLTARLLPVEHNLQIGFWKNVPAGKIPELSRKVPLIKPDEAPLLRQALEYAIKMYPNG
jgi:phosphoribosylglycinamide formyltransferase 1